MASWRSPTHRQGVKEARCSLERLFGRVSRCCLSWLWGCGRFILVVIPGYVHPVWWICLLRDSWANLLQKIIINNQIAALKNRSCSHAENCDFPSGAVFSCIFCFGSSRCCGSEGFPTLLGRKPEHLLGRRRYFRMEQVPPVERHVDDHQFIGASRRRGAAWSAFLGEFRDVAWAGFEAVVGSF